ncbi:MAG TPA: PAS domain-containing protein, partial [Marmoricola sp.]|nr:PAS domain-containing protein [Marmoricola sp.]
PFNAATRASDFECRLAHKEKGFRHFLWSARPFVAENKVYAFARDITERKHAEAALRESEARFRHMADSAPVFIWQTDISKAFVYFNQPWLDFTVPQGHLLLDEMDGKVWGQLVTTTLIWVVLPVTLGVMRITRAEVK